MRAKAASQPPHSTWRGLLPDFPCWLLVLPGSRVHNAGMTRRRKKWVVLLTLGVLAVAGIVGTRLYVTSPGYRVRSLLEQAGGRPPSAFRSFLVKAHLARPDLQSPAIVPRIILIGRPAVAALTEALKAPDPNVRRLAIEAMGELAQGAEFEHVVVMLRDPDQNVRYSAMEVLGRVRYIPAIEPLAGMIATENNGSWFPAADALLAIGDARVARPLLQAGTADSALRRDLLSSPHAEQLARLGGPQVRGAFVQAMLVPSTLWVAEAGAEGLGMMHNPGAADDLLAVIERQHLFPRLLARVARSLGQIGDKRAVEPLARLLTDESVDVRLGGLGQPVSHGGPAGRFGFARCERPCGGGVGRRLCIPRAT